jgi:predicted Zn-dependent protease
MEILLKNGLKKEDEFEADRVGILLTALAGYDAQPYREYLSRVAQLESTRTEVVHKTHPPFSQRLQAMDETINTSHLAELHYPILQQRFENYARPAR